MPCKNGTLWCGPASKIKCGKCNLENKNLPATPKTVTPSSIGAKPAITKPSPSKVAFGKPKVDEVEIVSPGALAAAKLMDALKISPPDTITTAFRGEDNRDPYDIKKVGGFDSWIVKDLESARRELRNLVKGTTKQLAQEAKKWCEEKDRVNGWFFSTATTEKDAYNTAAHFFSMDVSTLRKRAWEAEDFPEGISELAIQKMHLYTDSPRLSSATLIAVIWGVRNRDRELLIMSPISNEKITILHSKILGLGGKKLSTIPAKA